MEQILNPVYVPAHLAYVVIAVSYFLTNMFWLRVAAVIGLFLEILYFNLSGNGYPGLIWDTIFILINLYELIWLLRDRINARLPPDEAPALRQAFEGLDDSQIAKLLRAAEWRNCQQGDILTRQDMPVDSLYFLFKGRANVEVDGSFITYLESGSFVGEIAYLTGNPANAKVTVEEPSRILVFSKVRLAKVVARDRQLSGILYQVLGRDLAQKMRRSNSRKVLEDQPVRP
ncbi:MAG: cyclic nucleotide-binding domain-containing protein [Alphaproteobacteria bacterium]|nr:cyclic nucleotide-binding domain-containing protein [Alphaproteobacteria bacterium]